MTSTPRSMRPLLLGRRGCCARYGQQRLQLVRPQVRLRGKRREPVAGSAAGPRTAGHLGLRPPCRQPGGLGGAQAAAGSGHHACRARATDAYPKIGKALEGIDGVVINGRAEALGSYDVTYKGQSFLVRVQDSNGGSRLLALEPRWPRS